MANTELFPEPWHFWDSLGETFAAMEERELAIANYHRSLEINPDTTNARDMLLMLQALGN